MLSKGQGATMGTYDTLLLAFDKDQRADEAASLWNMILHTHARSISKRLFSRMISLYDHHDMQDKIIDVIKMGAIASHPSLNEINSPVTKFSLQLFGLLPWYTRNHIYGMKYIFLVHAGICRHGGAGCKTR